MLYSSFMFSRTQINTIYDFLLFYSYSTLLPLSLSKCSSPSLLLPHSYFTYIHVHVYVYTPALLLLYYYLSCCICIYALLLLYSGLTYVYVLYDFTHTHTHTTSRHFEGSIKALLRHPALVFEGLMS